MTERFALKYGDYRHNPAGRQLFNKALFTEVAPQYDFVTRALSFGQDMSWKMNMVKRLPAPALPLCVDIACGTGDITRLLATRFPDAHVVGLDLTPSMLDIARAETVASNVSYQEGSMQSLPFESGSVGILTGGYALRNAPDLDVTLRDVSRVLCNGGVAAFLDFSKPVQRPGQWLNHGLLKVWGSLWGVLLHGNADVYAYIADSLHAFPHRQQLRAMLASHDCQVIEARRHFGGLLETLIIRKGGGSRT